MELLGAIFLSREIDNNKDSLPIIATIIIAIGIYIRGEKFILEKFSGHIAELILIFVLGTYLIYRYSYRLYKSGIDRWGLYYILKLIVLVTAVILGFIIFNKVGTPFSYFIDKLNFLNWSGGNLIEAIGEIIWFIFKGCHIATKIFFFIWLHNLVIYYLCGKKIEDYIRKW